MSPVGRTLIKRVGFSVDLFSENLAPKDLGPPHEYGAMGCLRDMKEACQYLSDTLPNVRDLWVFLWESNGWAEDVVNTTTETQRVLVWQQALLRVGFKILLYNILHFKGRTIMTVHGEML